MNRFIWMLSFIFILKPIIGMQKKSLDYNSSIRKIHWLKKPAPYCNDAISSLAISPDGSKLALKKNNGVGLWDLPTASGVIFINSSEYEKVVWVPDEDNLFGIVANVGNKQIVSLCDTRTKQRAIDDIELSRDPLTNPIVFTQEGKDYFVGNIDGSINWCSDSLSDSLQKFLPSFPRSGIKDWHIKKLPLGSILSNFSNQARCSHIFFLANCLAYHFSKTHSKPVKKMALSTHKSYLASYSEFNNVILSLICYEHGMARKLGQKKVGLPAQPSEFIFDHNDNLIVALKDGALVLVTQSEYEK